MKFVTVLAQIVFALCAFGVPNPLPGSDDIAVRDPAIWYNAKLKKYFVFSTNEKIKIFTSKSLTGPWKREGSVLPDCSKIDLPGKCTLWAPDVTFHKGKYVLYYSVSTIGNQNSAIGVATSPSMLTGTWEDLGAVITSKSGDPYNAIDPNVIDHEGLKMTFGSYWNGMYQVGIWPDVNDRASPLPGTHIAGDDGRPAEGPFIYKSSSSKYYFCFFSDGITPLSKDSRPESGKEYKVRVGRGNSAIGPFYDQSGKKITEGRSTGYLVLGSHDNIYAPGGQSIFHDPVSKRDVMAYHYVKKDAPEGSYLGLNYLDFSSDWPKVV